MKAIHLVGRIFIGGIIVVSALINLLNFNATVAYTQSMNVPAAGPLTLLAMLLLLASGLSLLTGILPRLGILGMVVFLIPVSILMHPFWLPQDPLMAFIQMRFFEENMMLLGSVLMFLAIPTPWPYSLKLPVARRAEDRALSQAD